MKKLSYNDNKNIIHRQLRHYRELRGLSQEQLAAKLQTMNVNIDQQMISKIEHNQRLVTDYELACLCTILNVTERDLPSDFYRSVEL
ncbi:helix-turn-helix domain-containing protein [uncultured Dysosmobacter sp.]|uniref:helix-turn-helix domain-containing protein n=1 Tax=uncultured Dysosmobacter sp. TaxID=2591384 RepID=UPI00262A805C|nr:helix-turn-helix transcriptional regulator [uncultured Dysosmobacter sp.]